MSAVIKNAIEGKGTKENELVRLKDFRKCEDNGYDIEFELKFLLPEIHKAEILLDSVVNKYGYTTFRSGLFEEWQNEYEVGETGIGVSFHLATHIDDKMRVIGIGYQERLEQDGKYHRKPKCSLNYDDRLLRIFNYIPKEDASFVDEILRILSQT